MYRIDDPSPHTRKDLHLLSKELDIEHHYPLDDLTDGLQDGHKIALEAIPQFFDTRPKGCYLLPKAIDMLVSIDDGSHKSRHR